MSHTLPQRMHPTPLPGVWHVQGMLQQDLRGSFYKPFVASQFAQHGLVAQFAEAYVSQSAAGVVRGMHYQAPPHHHAKLVCALAGVVLDVVLDLRPGPGYGQCHSQLLDSARGDALYIPTGCAHGFCTPDVPATLLYLVSSEYHNASDVGVLWDSFGFGWPLNNPILSERDLALPPLAHLHTPF